MRSMSHTAFAEKMGAVIRSIPRVSHKLQSEEATKHALIIPALAAIGFDVSNPDVVVPEMVSDFGTRKAEKVDYAILCNGFPAILVECKAYGVNLQAHVPQLFRYFSVSTARIGVLTNGVEYRLYTDTFKENVMDTEPYAVVDLSAEDADLEPLEELQRALLDTPALIRRARERALEKRLRAVVAEELQCPSEKVFKVFAEKVLGRPARRSEVRELMSIAVRAFGHSEEEECLDGFRESAASVVRGYINEAVPGAECIARDTVRYLGFYYPSRPRNAICRLYFGAHERLLRISFEDEADRRPIDERGLEEYKEEIMNRARELQA